MTPLKSKTGIKLLIIFYSFIFLQNIIFVGQVKTNFLMAAVFLGTLVYIIFGFLKRTESARIIAIIFHGAFQILETITFFVISPAELLKKTMGDVSAQTLMIGQYTFIGVLALLTLLNISAIIYLVRNKNYFHRQE
jgi:hypothetical protein